MKSKIQRLHEAGFPRSEALMRDLLKKTLAGQYGDRFEEFPPETGRLLEGAALLDMAHDLHLRQLFQWVAVSLRLVVDTEWTESQKMRVHSFSTAILQVATGRLMMRVDPLRQSLQEIPPVQTVQSEVTGSDSSNTRRLLRGM